jgi:Lrp/AsnC family transcriptional regulator, leucine-responsive regulatory protein
VSSIDKKNCLDEIDLKILGLLTTNARMSWAELASELGLSAPGAADRVKRLEQRGVIHRYVALVAPELVGAEVAAFVAVELERPRHRSGFLKRIMKLDAVLECHHAAGGADYLLKVRVGNLRALEALVSDAIKSIDGVASTRTTIVLSTLKETPTPPLGGG